MGCIHSKGCIGHVPDSPRQEPKVKDRMKAIVIESAHSSASSNEEDGDDEDRLHVLCANRDSDMGISRLSRVSSQFLPPEGSKTVRVPLGDYELRYSFLSQRGFYPEALDKPNQDSFCIHTPFGTNPNDHFFGVFDGHGEYGAECSQFVKRKLCENLLRNCCLQVDVIEAINASFLTTNSQLHADVLDDSMSGTTAIAILVRGRTIYVANAGDSRAIIAERRGKDIAAIDLSIDQTPFRSDELERVRHCGARVLTLDQIEGLKNPDVKCWGTEEDDDGDPPRLWVQSGMYPGTAFTRSIGDSIAESIGVVASPEIYALELTHNHPFFVIASDGVFEFLSSQTVVEMVAKFKDPRDACAAIVAESYRLWLRYETRTDDITIIVVHVNGLNEAEDVQSTLEAPSRTLPHVIEETGSESPFLGTLNSRSHCVRHELSRTRLKAIESSLVNGDNWFPPVSHRKTWEEEAHIERVIRDHFLFKKLTNSQCLILLDCMKKVEVKPGDVVVEQGGEGDCFYVVTNGEFEVLATQEEGMEVVTKVLHRYTAEKLSSFGELALMYNKPLQSSVRAVTAGTLWALKREDFRGILTSEFSNIASFKLLRSVEPFSRLTILQLSRIAESLVEVSFSDGQTIIEKDVPLLGLYIIQKGLVRLSYIADSSSPVTSHLFSTDLDHRTALQDNSEHVVELAEGSYFGEWTLFGELVGSLSASSIGDSVCLVITKEKFDSAVGSVPKLPQEDRKMEYSLGSSKETILNNDASTCQRINASDLEWKMTISATDCYEIGQVLLKGTDVVRTLMRFSRRKIEELGNEEQVMKEKKILMSFNASASVPPVLCTYLDRSHVGILLDCCLACSLSSILAAPLDENSVRFCAASLVVSLEELHKNSVLHRGISPDAVMVDQTGHLQLVDFRFAKKFGERTFNICGIADSSAPEIILGKGHGFAADWRALGALIYFLLRAETPFGSWTESELETFAEISKGYLTNNLLHTFSIEAVDFITKLLDVSEVTPFERDGPDSLKAHSWFNGVDWKQVVDGTFPVPLEITCRINAFLEKHVEQAEDSLCSPTSHEPELSSPEWLEDW